MSRRRNRPMVETFYPTGPKPRRVDSLDRIGIAMTVFMVAAIVVCGWLVPAVVRYLGGVS